MPSAPPPGRASCSCAASAGLDYWRYGLERLSAACRAAGIRLAVLPGDDRPDPRLAAYATVPEALCDELDAYFRAGGVENMRRLLARIGQRDRRTTQRSGEPPDPVPRAFAWTRRTTAARSLEAPDASPLAGERPARAPPRLSLGDPRRRHAARSRRSAAALRARDRTRSSSRSRA